MLRGLIAGVSFAALIVGGGCLLLRPQRNASPSEAMVYPGATWARPEPAAAGFNEQLSRAFADAVQGAGCIVHEGRMVYAWGKYDQRADVASIVKPVIIHFILKAYEEGLIPDLDAPVADRQSRLKKLNADLDHKDRHVTWRDMMTQSSCYGVSEPPGEAFDYSDIQMALLWDTLIHKVHKIDLSETTEALLKRELTVPIGCQDAPILTEAGRLRISARDLARIGWLYLARGTWNGRRLLESASVALVLESPHPPSLPRTEGQPADVLPKQRTMGGGYNLEDHLNSYSYCWWLNGVTDSGERVLPGAPADTFGAFGHGGRHALIVIPSRRLVVAWVTGLGMPPPRLFSVDGRRRVDTALSMALSAAPRKRAP